MCGLMRTFGHHFNRQRDFAVNVTRYNIAHI